jgi:hypothetical protein
MPAQQTGRPSYATGRYDFMAHLDHLAKVLPGKRLSNGALHAKCRPGMDHITYKQFMLQLRGRIYYHPNLPELLEAHIRLATFGIAHAHWLDLKRFMDALPEPGSLDSAPEQLRALLDQSHKNAPMLTLDMVPVNGLRQIGEDDPRVSNLRPGPHEIRYRTGAPNGTAIHLLLLEYSEARRQWLCANRVKGVSLSIDRPLGAAGAVPVHIMSSPGCFSLFALAATSPFSDETAALIESPAIGADGVLGDEMTAAILKNLANERPDAPRVGRFRYRVA